MITKVSNTRANRDHTLYIGRTQDPYHWGNPFPIGGVDPTDPTKVFDRTSCILAFHDWLAGKPGYEKIEQDRRRWILENLETLRGQTLGCFCAPKACHGDVYRVFLGEISYDDLLEKLQVKPARQAQIDDESSLQGSLF